MNGLVQGEFVPNNLTNYPWIYVAKARVIPNSCGEFHIAFINTTDFDVKLKRRKYLGKLTPCSITVTETDDIFVCGNTFNLTKIVIGEETPTGERQDLLAVLNEYKDVLRKIRKNRNLSQIPLIKS